MLSKKSLAACAAISVLASVLMTGVGRAQETSSGIDGVAHGTNGAPIANAPVTVVFEPTNQTFTTRTDAQGLFSLRQLPPGGPYRVTVAGPSGPVSQEVQNIGLGAPYQLDLSGGTAVSAVVVTGRRGPRQLQTGPRSTFTATDIETLPSFSRDFKDIARLNPFVTLDPSNSNGLIIAGNSYRASTIYVDGVRQSDDFGLNSNGYPTQRTPLSFDLVQSLNVEVAPMDVSYGEFTGGVLNIATKSGTNEFHGTAYYDYDSRELGGGEEIFNRYVNIPFKDKTYGLTIGGPIIKDHLFFEFGYEKYEGLSTAQLSGPQDATGGINQVPNLTSAEIQQIQQILQQRYGFNAGGYGQAVPVTDEKFFGKMTWQITDKQRLVFEAQSDDGQSYTSGSGTNSVALSSNGYILDQPLTSYSGYLYSNWTPNFSTELSYTDRTVGRNPIVGLAGQPEYDIYVGNSASSTTPLVIAGTNYSYQANELNTEDKLFRARANYTWGSHTFLLGYEHEDRYASDLFIQNANGTWQFIGINNLQNGTASKLTYANAADNSSSSGVIPLRYTIHTGYLQDEWRVLPNLTLRLGVRDEYYEQSDRPIYNPFLFNTFGYNNTKNINGLNVFMPRFGFNWRPMSNLTITGGVGRFSGGSPDVYINNAFNGSGNILGQVVCPAAKGAPTATAAACTAALTNVTGPVPASIKALNTASANAGTGVTTLIAPNFQPPSVWKASISGLYTLNFADWSWTRTPGQILGNDWRFHVDYVHQWTDEGLLLKDLDTLNAVIGTAPDGRPIFDPNRTTTNRYDLLLTNTHKGRSDSVAVGLGKTFASGLDFDLTYIHTVAKDVNPFTSSVSLSNFRTNAFSDPNNPALAISNYSIPNEVKLRVGYDRAFFGDNHTRFELFATERSGLPFSYVYALGFGPNGLDTTGFGLSSTLLSTTYPDELVYVPKTDSSGNVTATSDPKVTYGPGFSVSNFNTILHQTGLIKYAGQISPRDAFNSRDYSTIDVQLTQEIPAFFPHGAKAEIYFAIFNLANLINSNWGVLQQYAFPYESQLIQATIKPCAAGGTCAPGQTSQYVYTGIGTGPTRSPSVVTTSSGNPPPSTWAMKIGIRYKF